MYIPVEVVVVSEALLTAYSEAILTVNIYGYIPRSVRYQDHGIGVHRGRGRRLVHGGNKSN